ncbi:hypothetical protein HJG60_008678 [Phyllostomus discolor]|uniref:Uncharacterized protein n=1 Tax=Phyllostomus discolor TaxID=89673 RepID=A0A834DLC4_9CHIR|nr:hypothetical protein HJG60_008678 [Phyllostomus discolor]
MTFYCALWHKACVAYNKEIFGRKLENEGPLAWRNRMEVSACVHVRSCPQTRTEIDARSASGFAAQERRKKLATSRCCIPAPNNTPGRSGSPGGRKEHTSPLPTARRRETEARSWLCCTPRALHRAEAQLTLEELEVLGSPEGERGLKGLGDFWSVLQEGQLSERLKFQIPGFVSWGLERDI